MFSLFILIKKTENLSLPTFQGSPVFWYPSFISAQSQPPPLDGRGVHEVSEHVGAFMQRCVFLETALQSPDVVLHLRENQRLQIHWKFNRHPLLRMRNSAFKVCYFKLSLFDSLRVKYRCLLWTPQSTLYIYRHKNMMEFLSSLWLKVWISDL